ncbi:SMI1 / KNR4 family [Campylobacter devanensis]|uniref:SMI1 / KNR4 family protein n=1 Tax=Campylobacter devanensis TaxID=3161138 RepID=A0A1X9SRX5_9BACT|nr:MULTISPECIES: SMI1/KNR4 family protein [Campylobacter]ARQ98958.1 SMI1 / KNR4 family protein [Campylobacter lanienae]MEE3695051.1 SMI1/KNR4 family protein [Campylobacter sp. CLAX-22107-21]SUX02028.1 SMI1 / KNR4 family [Campylobacter lanienae]
MEWKYVKNTTIDRILEVEKQYNIKLPEDLKQCILSYNNGRPSYNIFDTQKTKNRTIKKLLSYNKEDKENIFTFANIIGEENKNCFPIAIDEFGNFICLQDNKIVLWLHETASVEFIANSFNEFLELLHK